MITAIQIPYDENSPLKRVEIDAEDYEALSGSVGGSYEVLNLGTPPASIVSNEGLMLWELPYNTRATLLLWLHAKAIRGRHHVNGNALVTGMPDERGVLQSVPDELMKLLMETGTYYVERLHRLDGPWARYERVFTDWAEAYNFAIVQEESYAVIQDTRVVAG